MSRSDPVSAPLMLTAGALLSVVLSACSPGRDAGADPTVETADSLGVEIVRNRGAEPLPLQVVEELRIGAVESEEKAVLFSRIRDILLDEEGRIYVANDQTRTVRVFEADGSFLREFGGPGEGPSEVPSMINELKWAGDELVVIDWQRGGKNIVFGRDGVFIRSWRSSLPDGTRVSPAGYTPQGWVTLEFDNNRPDEPTPGEPYPQARRLRRIAPSLDAVGEVLTELPARELYGSPVSHGLDWPLFDAPEGQAFDAAGRFYRSGGEEYLIDVHAPDGRKMRSIRRDFEATPITEADIDEHRERAAETMRDRMTERGSTSTALIQQSIDRSLERIDVQATLPGPDVRPPLGDLLVSRDGSIWVERLDAREPAEWWTRQMFGGFDGAPEVETTWDLFTPRGRYRGTVVLPPRFSPMAVSADAVVGVMMDDLDVEYVVRFRIQQGD